MDVLLVLAIARKVAGVGLILGACISYPLSLRYPLRLRRVSDRVTRRWNAVMTVVAWVASLYIGAALLSPSLNVYCFGSATFVTFIYTWVMIYRLRLNQGDVKKMFNRLKGSSGYRP